MRLPVIYVLIRQEGNLIQHETEAEGVPLARRPLGLSSEMAGKLIGRML